MSLRQLITGTTVAWDGVNQSFPAGTLVEIEPGSALGVVYGPDNLVDLSDPEAAEAVADHSGVSN
jgi:hypothetical protein